MVSQCRREGCRSRAQLQKAKRHFLVYLRETERALYAREMQQNQEKGATRLDAAPWLVSPSTLVPLMA